MYVLLVIYVTTASSTLHASGQGGGGKWDDVDKQDPDRIFSNVADVGYAGIDI